MESPLRIALFAPALPESGTINGIVTYTGIMRDALRALGHSVIVLAGDHIEHKDGQVTAIGRSNRALGSYRRFVEARQPDDGSSVGIRLHILNAFLAARREGAEVFEIEESFGWASRLVGRGAAIVTRLHGPHGFVRDQVETPEQRRLGDLREAAEIISFNAVQAVTSPTERLLDGLTQRYGLKLPLARVIPNPIGAARPADRWNVDRATADQLLFVGRFDLCKGADVVLRAFAKALETRPSLTLVMAGPDSGLAQRDGSKMHFDEFVATEFAPEVRKRVHFFGPLPGSRIAELRLQSAFALVLSRFEAFSYTVAEAMAVGMPVLASDCFGPSELIRDGVDGRIVPVADVTATADAMVAMASNPAHLARMGRSAYARAGEWLSPERIARETVALYREAIGRR